MMVEDLIFVIDLRGNMAAGQLLIPTTAARL